MSNRLRVLFLASEASPFVKVGGLGDIAESLPRSLRSLPQALDVRSILPFHSVIDKDRFSFSPVSAFTISYAAGPIPRARDVYTDKCRWRGLQLRGIRRDFSGVKSAKGF